MTRVLIWPDIYKEQGHIYPCIALAKTLKDASYSVRFMGIKDCESVVTDYKGEFVTILSDIYPAGHTYENRMEPLNQRWKPHHLLPIATGALSSVFTGPNAPHLLISGYLTGLETLLVHYLYGVPFVLITTFLRHPQDSPAVLAKAKLLNMPRPVAQKLIDTVVPVAKRGMGFDDFIEPLREAKEMIPCPKAFDFADRDWKHDDSTVSMVEPMVERAPLDGSVYTPKEPITVPEGKRLLFATSGSQVRDYEDRARVFFKALIEMMQTQGMDQYYLVIAAGSWLYPALTKEYNADSTTNSTLPSNVVLRDWVSQLDILGSASAAFIHGGLATIKEAIWEKVPIVIVPHGKDQVDNAMRIRRAGLGVVSKIEALNPLNLRKLLTRATADTWIRQNLVKMQATFVAAEHQSPKASLTLVSGVVPP